MNNGNITDVFAGVDVAQAAFGGAPLRLALERHLALEQGEAITLTAWRQGRKMRGGSVSMPRWLCRRLAGVVRALPAGWNSQWDASTEWWVFRVGEEYFLAQEHYNPRANTCCSSLKQIQFEVARDVLSRHHRLENVADFMV